MPGYINVYKSSKNKKIMKIVEPENPEKYWWSFFIPIQSVERETEEEFLTKAKLCLEAFFEQYTLIKPELRKARNPFVKVEDVTRLKGAWEKWYFDELDLREMPGCNVEFYVGTPQDNYGHIGICVITDANDKERQKHKIDFLKQKWREFQYEFNPRSPQPSF